MRSSCLQECLPARAPRLPPGTQSGGDTSIFLKTLQLAKCDLGGAAVVIFHHLPRSLEHLELSGNRLRRASTESLGTSLSFGWLPNLLSLDLTDNPLGPSGLKAFARGLSSSPQSLPLQSLKLARTKIKAEGVEALAEALKAKKTTSLQTLDLAENEMRPAGLKHFASAVNAEAVPHLKVLVLREYSTIPSLFIQATQKSLLLSRNPKKGGKDKIEYFEDCLSFENKHLRTLFMPLLSTGQFQSLSVWQ
uniref:Uncharacterized protein n=1 Tax=Chromera velia CCMP2878 TaxID=1169474 RepID=A0A0G4H4B4_9ALVE|eukprot:Cvel_24642.t1-p1 / transcript=Cvel_24642.t1 / gene=Cvel_24642 / organism=Chromera_velia_CCMP2878 / gene_product=hypothetical protein / transcript_product=hypothetical protein / location=Cvel_scaffold2692:807-2170(-) / protein_length=248 / sequence_SO=supercontig / SO=protein_coding / is_pseudo=false